MTNIKTLKLILLAVMLIVPGLYGFSQESKPGYLSTGLPICYINYPADSVITRENKIDAEMIIQTPDDTITCTTKISGRGNYTWTGPKKPYNLKFDKKISLLGISPNKKYALMANYFDLSLWRIAIGMKLGELVDFEYQLQGRYVELVLNGEHQGCYFLSDRVSSNNVPYDKATGCILEYTYDTQVKDDGVYFFSYDNNWRFGFKDPDDPLVGGSVYNNAVTKINRFEEAVVATDCHTNRRWVDLVDMDNFVKWYYWKNIMQMQECNRYYVIENDIEDTKIKMGPLWDYDWSIGRDPFSRYYIPYFKNKLYFYAIGVDTLFLQEVAEYHFSNRERIESELDNVCDSLTALLESSEKLDDQKWNIFQDNSSSWRNELELDRTFMHETFQFLDKELSPFYIPTNITCSKVQMGERTTRKLIKNNQIIIVRNGIYYTTTGVQIPQ